MAGRRVGLTVKEIENARADGADRWLNDGGGLFLHVRPAGTKTWRLRGGRQAPHCRPRRCQAEVPH